VEPPPPPPPDPALVEASRKAEEQVVAESAARASARGPTVVGRSYAEIATGNVQHQRVEAAKMEEATAAVYQRAAVVAETKAQAQAEATALLT
jgi:hypothetical protein